MFRITKTDTIIILCLILLAIGLLGYVHHRKIQSVLANQSAATANVEDTTNTIPVATSKTINEPTPSATTQAATAICHLSGLLPDPSCTPGVIDARVTQATIHQTICVAGYTKSVRPAASITSKEKLKSMQQYGFTDSATHYEYDHLISLELGGAPNDLKNLWPEPGASPNPKDKIEDRLHSLVCKGEISLAEAQSRIATNWTTALAGY